MINAWLNDVISPNLISYIGTSLEANVRFAQQGADKKVTKNCLGLHYLCFYFAICFSSLLYYSSFFRNDIIQSQNITSNQIKDSTIRNDYAFVLQMIFWPMN